MACNSREQVAYCTATARTPCHEGTVVTCDDSRRNMDVGRALVTPEQVAGRNPPMWSMDGMMDVGRAFAATPTGLRV